MRAVIACLLLIPVAACDRQSPPAPQPKAESPAAAAPEETGTLDISHRGSAMPKDAFVAPDGKPATLAQFRGKPVLVNLWATWCGPCVKEMPSLDRLAARAGDRLTVLTVSQDTEGGVVGPWWAARKFARLQPWLDPKANLGFTYETGMLPTTVLYDKDGKEVWRIAGGMNWDGPRANTLLGDILG